jgi:16S rRNA (guanine1516-N2)-methyltransferase
MKLIGIDAIEYLQNLVEPVDVIYLDPMYPYTEKTAKVKKEMASFREIVGEDLDDEKLLAAALDKAIYRVVVKRPRLGTEIIGQKPSLQLMGKSSRFDIYTNKGLS